MTVNNGKKERINPNRERTVYLFNIIVLCLITLASLAAGVFMLFRMRSLTYELNRVSNELDAVEGENKTVYTAEELEKKVKEAENTAAGKARHELLMQIESSLESGSSTLSMLRELFSEDLVVMSGGKYYFYPVLNSLEKNSLSSSDFRLDDTGFLSYQGSDAHVSVIRGIDVSQANGQIRWPEVAGDGIGFAMIQAGMRDEEGVIVDDELLEENLTGAVQNEISAGICYTLGALDTAEAVEEADHLIALLAPFKDQIRYPVAVSIHAPDAGGRLSSLTKTMWTQNLIAFCDRIREAGYKPMIQGSISSMIMLTNYDQLENYDKWIGSTDTTLYFPYRFSMWQYSGSGQVQGIDTAVNLDIQVTYR